MPFISTRRNRPRPASVGGVDWSNGISRKLEFLTATTHGAGYPYDLVRGIRANSGTVALVNTPAGYAQAVANDSAKVIQFPGMSWLDSLAAPMTVLVYARHSQASVGGFQGVIGGVGSDSRFFIGLDFSRNLYFSTTNGSDAVSSLVLPASAVRYSTIAATYSGSSVVMYLDGQTQSISYSTASSSTSNNIRLGGNAGGNNFPGDIAIAAVWSRVLSKAELDDLAANPWRLFLAGSPRTRFLIPDGAGSVTASYAATLGDTTFAGVAARTLPASAAGTYAATLGNLTAALTATFTAAPNRSATYAATMGDTVFAGVAARTLPANAAGTYAATLGDTTLAAVASRTLPANAAATYAATLGNTTLAAVASFTAAGSVAGTYSATLGNTTLAATASFTAAANASAAYAATLGNATLSATASASGPGSPGVIFPLTRVRRFKHAAGRRVDTGDDVTRGLIAAWNADGGATIIDAVRGVTLSRTGAASMVTGPMGARARIAATGDNFRIVTPDHLRIQPPLCIMFAGRQTASPTAFATLAGCIFSDANTSPFLSYALFNDSGTYTFAVNNGTTLTKAVGAAPSVGEHWFWGQCAASGANNLQLVVDSNAAATATFSGTISYGTNSSIGVGEPWASIARNANFDYDYLYVWNRTLTDQEAASIRADPYQVFLSTRRGSLISIPGSGNVNASYSAAVGDTTLSGVASRTLPANAAGTYAATLGDTVLMATAARTLPSNATGTYAATLGDTVFAGVAARTLPGNATASFSATLGNAVLTAVASSVAAGAVGAVYAAAIGDTVLSAVASRTTPANATGSYSATLGNTAFSGVASRTLPGNVTATFAATLGSIVLVGTAGDFSALALYPTWVSGPVTVSQTGGFFGPVTIRGVEKLDGLVTVIDTIDPNRTSVRVK